MSTRRGCHERTVHSSGRGDTGSAVRLADPIDAAGAPPQASWRLVRRRRRVDRRFRRGRSRRWRVRRWFVWKQLWRRRWLVEWWRWLREQRLERRGDDNSDRDRCVFGRRGVDRPHRRGRFPLVQIGRSVSGSGPGTLVRLAVQQSRRRREWVDEPREHQLERFVGTLAQQQLRIGPPTQLQLEQLVQQFRIVQFGEFL